MPKQHLATKNDHEHLGANMLSRKRPPKRERLVRMAYLGSGGQREESFIRESLIPQFLSSSIYRSTKHG